jgi:hypothetical protein
MKTVAGRVVRGVELVLVVGVASEFCEPWHMVGEQERCKPNPSAQALSSSIFAHRRPATKSRRLPHLSSNPRTGMAWIGQPDPCHFGQGCVLSHAGSAPATPGSPSSFWIPGLVEKIAAQATSFSSELSARIQSTLPPFECRTGLSPLALRFFNALYHAKARNGTSPVADEWPWRGERVGVT